MTKFIFLTLLATSMALAEASKESAILKSFVPTAFGIKSRTIDVKEAEKVLKLIQDFKINNPQTRILGIELLTCTSDYKLPQASVTNRKTDEHIQLAKERHMMIAEHLVRSLKLPVSGEARVCGPEYSAEFLNDRFVTIQSGAIFHERFKALIQSEGFVQKLKEEALVDDPELLKRIYPTPFLARFKPFQGVRVFIKGEVKEEAETQPKLVTPPSGKNQ